MRQLRVQVKQPGLRGQRLPARGNLLLIDSGSSMGLLRSTGDCHVVASLLLAMTDRNEKRNDTEIEKHIAGESKML
jgi:hypothetical protein